MSTDELEESLDLILESLPEEHEGPLRRRHSLTRHDAQLMANMIKVAVRNQGCSIGLTDKQIIALTGIPAGNMIALNEMVKERKRILAAVGAMTLAILGWFGQWLFTTLPWRRLWHLATTGQWV